MKKLTIIAIAAAGFLFNTSVMAQTTLPPGYKASVDRINAEFTSDKEKCESLAGNAKDICLAEAKGKEKVAKADLEAAKKNTKKARYDARIAKAESEYTIAKQKCDDKAGNEKDICLKEAKAAEVTAKADAHAQMKISNANVKANKETAEVRKDVSDKSTHALQDAATDKREANYAVAREKCDALAGSAKDECINEAKVIYSKR